MPTEANPIEIPLTPELRAIAKRVVWFQAPATTLQQPRQFVTYLMTYGTLDDVSAVIDVLGTALFRQALDDPLPGIFDGRSWRFWHLALKGERAPPLPRRFAQSPPSTFPGKR